MSTEFPWRYRDRSDAGRQLASRLRAYAGRPDVIVFGLARGGVPVAFEVARELGAPLDVVAVRKLGVPGYDELAMGAIASGGIRVVNQEVIEALGITDEVLDAVAEREMKELERRERLYRDNRPAPEVEGRAVILIDDGLATGSTMRAAIGSMRRQRPSSIVVAAPVAAAPACEDLSAEVEELVCPQTLIEFQAVGLWYQNFSQTTDREIWDLLERAEERGVRRQEPGVRMKLVQS